MKKGAGAVYYVKEIAAKLKALRIEKGLSQHDVAEKLRCSQGYISKLEQGKINLEIYDAYRICQVLGVSFSDFAVSVETIMETSFEEYAAKEEKMRADELNKELGQEYLDQISKGASLKPLVRDYLDRLPDGYVIIEFKDGNSVTYHKADGKWDNGMIYEDVRRCYFKYGKLKYLLPNEYD